MGCMQTDTEFQTSWNLMPAAIIILYSIHDAASYLVFIRRVRIRVLVRLGSCLVDPLVPLN